MNACDLKKRHIYFGIRYEDDACTRPLVHTYEYLGINVHASAEELAKGEEMYSFRRLGTEDVLEVTERELKHILNLEDATGVLRSWSTENATLLG